MQQWDDWVCVGLCLLTLAYLVWQMVRVGWL